MENKSIQTEKIIFINSFSPTTTTTTGTTGTTTATTTGTTTPTTTTTTTTLLTCCTNWTPASGYAIFEGTGSGCIVSNFVMDPIALRNYSYISECKIYVHCFPIVDAFWLRLYDRYPSSPSVPSFAAGYVPDVIAPAPQTVTLRNLENDIIYGTCDWNGIVPTIADYDINAYIYCP